MPAMSPERRHLRARKARLTQLGAETTEIDTEIATAKLEAHITRIVDEAPPLSDDQRNRLAALFRTPSTIEGVSPDAA